MKIGLYGGSFNPVHNEHVNIAIAAKRLLGLDKLIVIPAFIAPLKSGTMSARGKDRLAMCNIAFAGLDGIEVSDYELKRGGVSYSYVTCRHFKKLYKDDDLYFIIGADSLQNFKLWRQPEEILKCATLAVCAREDEAQLKKLLKDFQTQFRREIVTFGYVGKAVSSTRIRTLAALGEDVSAYVPNGVKRHICAHQLYFLPELSGVKKYLTEERWRHSVGVAVMAAQNSRRAGVYEIDAITAGALHDCAKYLGKDAPELKGFVCPPNVPAPVVHQYSGAYVAEHTFGIKDESVLNAIRYHTSGRENMSGLEKLIFLADLLEEGRDYDGVDSLRKIFARDIDGCLRESLERQLKRLNSLGNPVYPLTQRAYEYLKNS